MFFAVYWNIHSRRQIRLLSNLEYVYPILGRYKEMEYFNDILDDIGVAGRVYAGLLIEVRILTYPSLMDCGFLYVLKSKEVKIEI